MEKINKVFNGEIKEVKGNTVTVYVSTSAVDRDKEVILPTAWNLKNYQAHPVLLSSHKYDKLTNQIGKAVAMGTDEKGLWTTFEYFTGKGNFEADWGYFLAKQGIASYSVGFIPNKAKDGQNGVRKIYEDVELLEVSQVLVPANPEAVQGNDYEKQYLMAIKSFEEAKNSEMGINKEETEVEQKGVIPYHDYGFADDNYKWDAGKEVKQADTEKLKKMCAWYDSSKPDIKSSYKLPHHRASDLKAVWRGVTAAMAVILGARGGVNMPENEKKNAYTHLAKHYKAHGDKAPAYKEYENEEEILKACGITAKELDEVLNVGADVGTKSGRVLSEANRKKVQNAIGALKSAQTALEELLKLSETQTNSSPLGESKSEEGKELTEVLEGLKKALSV